MSAIKSIAIKRMKPTLSLDERDLPAIKNWSVGKRYQIMLTVEQTSMEKGDEYYEEGEGGSKKIHARFKVIKAEEC